MRNEVLEDIKNYAVRKLNESYGYCGVAEDDKIVSINSDDKKGNDITILIKEDIE